MGPATKAEWMKIAQRLGDLARLARAVADGSEQAADELKSACSQRQYEGCVLEVGIDPALAAHEDERQEEENDGPNVDQIADDAAASG